MAGWIRLNQGKLKVVVWIICCCHCCCCCCRYATLVSMLEAHMLQATEKPDNKPVRVSWGGFPG